MDSFFTSSFFAGNRRRLRESVGGGLIAIAANGLLQKGNIDTAYLFYQDADFWYLTGIDEPDIILIIDKDREYLMVPERPAIREAFDGAVDSGPLKRRSGVREVFYGREGWEILGPRLKQVKRIHTPAPHKYTERHGIYPNPARAVMKTRLKAYNRQLEFVDIQPKLAQSRMIKQPAELKAMQAAIDVTANTLKELFRPAQIRKYRNESELEADITRGFRRRGAEGHSFEPIVAGGKRACTLHNVANDSPLSPEELVIVDVGAEVEHYAADITRTVSLRKASPRQREVHAAVSAVQDYALSLLKPGMKLRDYETKVRDHMGDKLVELGLIGSKTPENIQRFYPHGTSHFIGLNVHDAGDYDRPLEPGVVVSCEPGIYIPDERIGVRIEDDVLITKDGNRVLTAKLPKSLR